MSILSELINETGLDPFGPCPVDMSYQVDPWYPRNAADALAQKIARTLDTTATAWSKANGLALAKMIEGPKTLLELDSGHTRTEADLKRAREILADLREKAIEAPAPQIKALPMELSTAAMRRVRSRKRK